MGAAVDQPRRTPIVNGLARLSGGDGSLVPWSKLRGLGVAHLAS